MRHIAIKALSNFEQSILAQQGLMTVGMQKRLAEIMHDDVRSASDLEPFQFRADYSATDYYLAACNVLHEEPGVTVLDALLE